MNESLEKEIESHECNRCWSDDLQSPCTCEKERVAMRSIVDRATIAERKRAEEIAKAIESDEPSALPSKGLKVGDKLYACYESDGKCMYAEVVKVNRKSYHFYWHAEEDEWQSDGIICTGGKTTDIGREVFFTLEEAKKNPARG